jgi:hypothetical protein
MKCSGIGPNVIEVLDAEVETQSLAHGTFRPPKVFVKVPSKKAQKYGAVIIDKLIKIDPAGLSSDSADLHRSSDWCRDEEVTVSAIRIPGQFRITSTPSMPSP